MNTATPRHDDRTDKALAAAKLLPKVERVARAISRRLPSHVNRDDVQGAALLGLAEALARCGAADEPAFEAYVMRRVRGSIADSLRGLDVLTRGERRKLRRLRSETVKLEALLGRPPAEDEVSRATGFTQEECQRLQVAALRDSHKSPGEIEVSNEDALGADTSPESLLGARRSLQGLRDRRERLPARLRQVVELYYDHELTLSQIGGRLGVSEGRVSQLRKRAIEELRRAA